MDESFRKWLELAKKVRPDSPFSFARQPTEEYLQNQISRNHWIYIGNESLKDCAKSDNPNLYFKCWNDRIKMGIAFNSNRSVLMARNILENYSANVKEELLRHLKSDSAGWDSVISIRQKYNTFADSPNFEERERVQVSDLDNYKIQALFVKAELIIDECRERVALPKSNPKHLSQGSGVRFNLIEKTFPSTEEEFKRAFAYAHDALVICLKVKTAAEYEKGRKTKIAKPYFPFDKRYRPKN